MRSVAILMLNPQWNECGKLSSYQMIKPLTFLCPSLSQVATYAVVSNNAYRIMKHLIPGPYTFLLPATKLVPRLVLNPKRKTTGIRVPDNKGVFGIIASIGKSDYFNLCSFNEPRR